ncbi:TRAP transporter small permease [Actibacterium sp. MT2.3-13A]|uniref:TRAP transporter small permease n=1 Tax=Actibacterium sp. MT2.3-13A TaxID=2828332 RepID=UPI001BAA0779|nr:TRAP transporter small permease [Actibacterium sp. MT2.3-13A]
MTSIGAALSKASEFVSKLTAAVCVMIIYLMLGLLSAQVFLRYFFGSPPSWTEEVAIILFAWLVLLYATVGVRERFHVAVDMMIVETTWLRVLLDKIVALAILGFGVVLFWAGLSYVERTAGQKSAALQIPIEVLHGAAPVCGALLAFHAMAILLSAEKAH